MAWLGARRERGFTLTELAVVFTIISLLLAAGMYTLSAQTEQRNFEETRRRLEAARELLFGFAIVNGRLPCPATNTSAGVEAPVGGGACTTPYPVAGLPASGFLPARSIGFQIVDAGGYAIDPWGARIRYAVSTVGPTCTSPNWPFTVTTTLRSNGLTCVPGDLVVCQSATGITSTACDTATPVTNQNTLVAIVFSIGRNGLTGSGGIDEAANVNGDRVFVWHPPTPAGHPNGAFDDQMAWIPVGEFYGKLIAAGVLP